MFDLLSLPLDTLRKLENLFEEYKLNKPEITKDKFMCDIVNEWLVSNGHKLKDPNKKENESFSEYWGSLWEDI